jgi:chromosome segregation ATPase
MQRKTLLALAVGSAFALALPGAQAGDLRDAGDGWSRMDASNGGAGSFRDRLHEVRHDWAEIRADRAQVREARKELAADRRELLEDQRDLAAAQQRGDAEAIAREKAEIRSDLAEIREHRGDLLQARDELNRDIRELNRDRFALRAAAAEQGRDLRSFEQRHHHHHFHNGGRDRDFREAADRHGSAVREVAAEKARERLRERDRQLGFERRHEFRDGHLHSGLGDPTRHEKHKAASKEKDEEAKRLKTR